MDAWQQQLATERGALREAQEHFERSRTEIGATSAEIDREREALRAAQAEIEFGQQQLQSSRALLEREQDELLATRDQVTLDRSNDAVTRAELERDRNELETTRTQFERERIEFAAAKSKLDSDWTELRVARGTIEQERDELRAARNQLERDRAITDQGQSEAAATLTAELNAARDRINALTTSLLSRTEELRTLDNRRSEVVTDLEVARAREKELLATLEEYKRTAEQEQTLRKEELLHLRELLERRTEIISVEDRVPSPSEARVPTTPPQPKASDSQPVPRENAVLGSIVEQFDKLRQQRASDRQSVSNQGKQR